MANVKEYQIKINGVQESIDAVETLNKQLNALESRIKQLESANVKVGTSSTAGASSTSTLSQDAALQKELNSLKNEGTKLEAKQVAYQDESYQKVLAQKDVLKEIVNDQKTIAAQERLQADTYSNTMQGMKDKLADLKAVINTTDLGDSESIKNMTQEANELTNKLKEMEEAYGQFGRNVGNYESAAEGFKGLAIQIGDVTQKFDNAKQAYKELSNELRTLQVKQDQGIVLSEDEVKRFKELPTVVAQLKSSIQDAGKPMDTMMDTMQSVVALAQATKGISAFFGLDGDEIERSIQKLVALQNAMKGIETINKQLQSGEFMGGMFTKANAAIDAFAAKVTNAKVAEEGLAVASNGAAKATKALSLALKGLGIGLVIAAVLAAVAAWDKYSKKVEQAKKAQEDAAKVQEEVNNAYAEASANLLKYQTTVKNFNGTKNEEKRLVKELNSELGNTLGTYKTLGEWMDVLTKKGEVYIKMLTLQAKAQAAFNNYVKALEDEAKVKEMSNVDFEEWWQKFMPSSWTIETSNRARVAAIQVATAYTKTAEEEMLKSQENVEKFMEKNGIGSYSDQIEKNSNKTKNVVEETNRSLAQLELRLMQDGLSKRLRQLDEEERQTINKLNENGVKTASVIKKVQDYYAQLRLNEINEYLKKLNESVSQTAKSIQEMEFSINTEKLGNQINELKNKFDELSENAAKINTLLSASETQEIKEIYKVDDSKLKEANTYQDLFNEKEAGRNIDRFYGYLREWVSVKNKELYQDIKDYYEAIATATTQEQKDLYIEGLSKTYTEVEKLYEKEYENELLYISNYDFKIEEERGKTLSDSIKFRLDAEEEYNSSVRLILMKNIEERAKLNKELVENEVSAATESERERYSIQMSGLTQQLASTKNAMAAIEKEYKVQGLEGVEMLKDTNEKTYQLYHELFAKTVEIEAQIEIAKKQHKDKKAEIVKEGEDKIKAITVQNAKDIAAEEQKGFDAQIRNLRDAQSKINDLLSKQPKYNSLGIVNIKGTVKNLNEARNAIVDSLNAIVAQKKKLEDAWKQGLITPQAKNATINSLNDLEEAFKNMLTSVKGDKSDVIPKFVQSLTPYIQSAMDAFSTIMNAVWNAQDTAFDKEQEQIDKYNEKLQEALEKQEKIVQDHKNAIDSIEDELETARGDRRQELIDRLNAEVKAEKIAAREKEKIAKEEERMKIKQDELDKRRKEAEYNRQIIQAIVNGAMAITMAAINKWPVPAIPMMALAATTTAAQIAIMKANKPYAKGGLLSGPSHSEGGMPILGSDIVVEGSEYVVNKKTTTENVEVLDYINSKKKRLSLDDFIDFYGKKSNVSRVVQSASPRKHFAEGGILPTMNYNFESANDRLLSAFEKYATKPSYVSVVDIIDKTDQLTEVQALAGLGQD